MVKIRKIYSAGELEAGVQRDIVGQITPVGDAENNALLGLLAAAVRAFFLTVPHNLHIAVSAQADRQKCGDRALTLSLYATSPENAASLQAAWERDEAVFAFRGEDADMAPAVNDTRDESVVGAIEPDASTSAAEGPSSLLTEQQLAAPVIAPVLASEEDELAARRAAETEEAPVLGDEEEDAEPEEEGDLAEGHAAPAETV